MSTTDDRLVLNEYEEWAKQANPLYSRSVKAFLEQREDKFNASRIANALTILNAQIPQFEQAVSLDGIDARNLVVRMNEIRDILEGDRPFVDDSTLTGPTTRTYL